ncbi:small, acid-soluble spore protein, alpha/beta type [Vallitalea guaymasensis]|uniref:small, acid-soluble spore protein, alpha/beta type n=1 Tax=Vallitalea guaymasensis TaxID=1185412 RepID=UPI002357E141|nr:small, acid-soluble spore protein, alpha/beta type [Vallitalea guaymasensis]
MKDINNTANKENNRKHIYSDDSYMGGLTSTQIGSMAGAGKLGGEMVKRMIASVEKEMADNSSEQGKLK